MIFYPPKPTLISIDQPLFKQLNDDPNVVAELKYNGNNLVLHRFEDGRFEFWNRHGSKFNYEPSKEVLSDLQNMSWAGYCVVNGELRHNKVKGVRHHIVLWDMFISNGLSLKELSFIKRRHFLENLFRVSQEAVTLTEFYLSDFKKIFDLYTKLPEIEGLVMKKLNSKLELGYTSSPTVKYMFKVRKANGSYNF
jgi:ATP-dependent DNA ligase